MIIAYVFRWVGDDIYVTLRYVDNFIQGNGLVYNIGERVEGFTHPLWLFLIIVFKFIYAFISYETIVYILGISSFLGVIYVSYKINGLFVPLCLLCLYDFVIWGTSGLETMLFTFLLLLAYYFRDKQLLMNIFLSLLVLTRPEGAFFIVIFNLFYFSRSCKDYLPYILPVIYLGFRIFYYHEIFPNTYFVKANGFNFLQGFRYLWLAVYSYPVLFFVFMLSLFFIKRNKDLNFIIYLIAGYLLYVVSIGGDFMFFRFIVPVIPFMFILIGKLKISKNYTFIAFLCLSMLFTKVLLRDSLLLEDGKVKSFKVNYGIIDERNYYTHSIVDGKGYIEIQKELGLKLNPYFEGLEARVLLRGQCCFGYYAGFSYCLINAGLADKNIAKQKIEKRGRVGHEKTASLDYIKQKKINFVFNRRLYLNDYQAMFFNSYRAEIITFNNDLFLELKDNMGDDFNIYKIK